MNAVETVAAEPLEHPARRGTASAMLVAMRPRQWTKNLLLFAGIIFAAKLGDGGRLAEAVAGFAAYCAASSSAYLLNDLRDVEADRVHPLKRRRPIASGELSRGAALWLAGGLASVALVLAALLGPSSLALMGGFAVLQIAYTVVLKHVVLIDVCSISGLFVIRAAAGAVAVDVRISPWLLLCTALLSLFLALGKRRGELVLVATSSTPGRRVLDGYSLAVVDRLLATVAAGTIVAYVLYTLTARSSHALTVTIPFVVFGLVRYVLLLHRRGLGEEPENVLVRDVPILVTVALWTLVCAIALART